MVNFRRENSSPKNKHGIGDDFLGRDTCCTSLEKVFFWCVFGGPKYLLRTDVTSFRPGGFFSVFIYIYIYPP